MVARPSCAPPARAAPRVELAGIRFEARGIRRVAGHGVPPYDGDVTDTETPPLDPIEGAQALLLFTLAMAVMFGAPLIADAHETLAWGMAGALVLAVLVFRRTLARWHATPGEGLFDSRGLPQLATAIAVIATGLAARGIAAPQSDLFDPLGLTAFAVPILVCWVVVFRARPRAPDALPE